MQSQNRFFDDLARVLNGAAGTFAGMAREAQQSARERARDWVQDDDAVSREEFETLKDRLAAARGEIAELKARLDAIDGGSASGDAKPRKRPKN